MKLYRFRSNLEYAKDELKRDYFHFSDETELNDPQEGFVKLFWKGDVVLWKNLLKHYLYTLANTVMQVALGNDLVSDDLPIFFDEGHFPTENCKSLFEDIRADFFNQKDIKEFLDYVVKLNHLIFQAELIFYLRMIHYCALSIVIEKFKQKELLNWDLGAAVFKEIGFFSKFTTLVPEIENKYKDFFPVMYKAAQSIFYEFDFSFKYNSKNIKQIKNKNLLLVDFPALYVTQLKRLVFYSPCIACFMENYKSPAIWGYYANCHKGICLIFDDDKNDSKIHFNLEKDKTIISTETQKVVYKKEYKEIDFFRMIGTISLYGLENFWLKDWEGNYSSLIKIDNNVLTKEWHKEYVKNMVESYTTKLPAWKHENEHRIILEKEFFAMNSTEAKEVFYDFRLLKGIVFGLKTNESEKYEIIELIKEKCEKSKRSDFKFYQTEYDESLGEISLVELKNLAESQN